MSIRSRTTGSEYVEMKTTVRTWERKNAIILRFRFRFYVVDPVLPRSIPFYSILVIFLVYVSVICAKLFIICTRKLENEISLQFIGTHGAIWRCRRGYFLFPSNFPSFIHIVLISQSIDSPNMKCCRCSTSPAVMKRPKDSTAVCRECFFALFEDEVHDTIMKNVLFTCGETVAIGASGGLGISIWLIDWLKVARTQRCSPTSWGCWMRDIIMDWI